MMREPLLGSSNNPLVDIVDRLELLCTDRRFIKIDKREIRDVLDQIYYHYPELKR